jgi:hypothetical protein
MARGFTVEATEATEEHESHAVKRLGKPDTGSPLVRVDEGRLVEVAGKMPGVRYGSLAQGVRRFWRLAEERGELKEFVVGMRDKCK